MEEIKYEEAMSELEKIVRDMESGNLDLDVITTKLKRAKELISLCNDKLTKTDQQIHEILESDK